MNLLGNRWALLTITIFLPLILLLISLLLGGNVCVVMILILWIGLALLIFYLPRTAD